MLKVLPFPFLVKVWNGSSWQMPSLFYFPSGSVYCPVLFHGSFSSARAECDYLRAQLGADACVFLHDACLSGALSVPCCV